ncbi:MAG: helix-turn-helix transcriptional regulator [Burkholderiales bacterium]|nr:helix-turn-helix transcriptional regulator [Phycisphaerae bacterium]
MTTLAGVAEPRIRGSAGFQNFAASVHGRLRADAIFVVTTLPRGGLRVCHSTQGIPQTISQYGAGEHQQDSAAWNAIRDGFATIGNTPLATGAELLLAVGLDDLVLGGFPAAVILLRKRDATGQAFEPAVEADVIRRLAEQELRTADHSAGRRRQYVFDASGNNLVPGTNMAIDDAHIAALRSLASKHSGTSEAIRCEVLPDSAGELTAVHITHFESYPALATGPVTFVSLSPRASDWHRLTAGSFDADPEMARLAQALGFIATNFRTGPTLGAIAGSVELSQYHFHRRFSELFGVTPKNLLFELQLDEAKRLLQDPKKPLADVARHCGFAHQSHFTSRFKQGTGLTPTRWRRLAMAK